MSLAKNMTRRPQVDRTRFQNVSSLSSFPFKTTVNQVDGWKYEDKLFLESCLRLSTNLKGPVSIFFRWL